MKIAVDIKFENVGEAARWLAKYTTSPSMPVYDLLRQEFDSQIDREIVWDLSIEIAKAAVRLLAKHFHLDLK